LDLCNGELIGFNGDLIGFTGDFTNRLVDAIIEHGDLHKFNWLYYVYKGSSKNVV